MAIEVFRTDLGSAAEAERIASVLRLHYPGARIHIDMHDVDRVLRLEGEGLCPETVTMLVRQEGYFCVPLD